MKPTTLILSTLLALSLNSVAQTQTETFLFD